MVLPEIVRHQPQIGAFFDMDKTILSQNSATLFMRYRYEHGDLGNVELLKGLGAYLQYKLGMVDLRRWTVMPAGGHFAPMEEPERLVEDIRAFFRPLRAG